MPIYQVIYRDGLLTNAQRDEIAAEITRLHTTATAAPALFVNVVFNIVADAHVYTAGKPSKMSFIIGEIRDGRPLDVRQELLTALSALWVRVTGHPESQLLVGLRENDPANAMELGLILPAAGQEAAWFQEHHERLAALGVR